MLWKVLFSALAASASVGVLAEEYSNASPIAAGLGPDPFVVYDNSTRAYYFLATPVNQLYIATAPTLNQLKTAERVTVYQDAAMQDKRSVWAPELHQLGGKWYLHYTFESMSYVLEGGANPMDPYGAPIQLTTDYGIDGTVLNVKDTPYFVWSCHRGQARSGPEEQALCIAPLTTPTEIDLSKVGVISQPTAEWEVQGRAINEGPAPLYWDNEVYLVFSGSFCFSPEYSLGLLHLVGDDPLLPESWQKAPNPVLTRGNGLTSTGHNAIFTSPDGTELWNVFHASENPEGSCGDDRQTYAQKIDVSRFQEQGPIFGEVQAPGIILPGPSGEDGDGPVAGPAPLPSPIPESSDTASSENGAATTPAASPGVSSPAPSLSGEPQSSLAPPPPPVLVGEPPESSATGSEEAVTATKTKSCSATGSVKRRRSRK